MNIHFVALHTRNHFYKRVLAAANAVSYRICPDDRLYIYSNLCLDSRDITLLRTELNCEVYLCPLSADEGAALLHLPGVVVSNAKANPNDANLLIDNDGICKRGRVYIIPSISSSFRR